SFVHLRAAMEGTDEAFLGRTVDLFGNQMSGLDLWVMTTTHLHEHLGQSIAYARSNGVVPPWSQRVRRPASQPKGAAERVASPPLRPYRSVLSAREIGRASCRARA